MKIILTASELIQRGYWEAFCTKRGIGIYAVNEGRMDSSEEFTFSESEAQELGITFRCSCGRGLIGTCRVCDSDPFYSATEGSDW